MKIFAIKESNNKRDAIGYLFYYEKSKEFYIELLDNLSEWDVPLLLSSLYKKGIRTIDSYWSKVWVQQRIVPIDRQNLGQILRDNKLSKYDEFSLLVLNHGKCPQDDYYISIVSENDLPEMIKNRFDYLVENLISFGNRYLLVVFKNTHIKMFDIKKYSIENSRFEYLLDSDYIENVDLLVGGHGVYWDNNFKIPSEDLYREGKDLPIDGTVLSKFVTKSVLTTQEVMKELNCSRQYVNELVKKGRLIPYKSSQKNNLFLESEVKKLNWF